MKKKQNDTDKVSNYTLLSKWLFDGSKTTQIPDEISNDKSISQNYLIYFFQQSPFIVVISKLFNNYNLYSLDKVEIFKFIKQSIMLSGYKPKYIPKIYNNTTKLEKILFKKFPYLKKYELPLLVDIIDNSEIKDDIYHMFGLHDIKKKKSTKKDIEKINEINNTEPKEKISVDDILGEL